MNKVLIGLTGEIGSGKSVFYDLLKEILPTKKIALVNYSDTLKDTLDLWFLERTRENFSKLAQVMNSNFGDDSLGNATVKRALKQEADVVIMAGLRWMGDLERLRANNGLLVYITADPKLRYERVKDRTEKKDEIGMSFEQFLEEHHTVNEQKITKIGAEADFVIENNGTLAEFREKVKEFLKRFDF